MKRRIPFATYLRLIFNPRRRTAARRACRLRVDQLEARTTPSAAGGQPIPAISWDSATGTPTDSTLVVGLVAGTPDASGLLAPVVATAGATLEPTTLPDVYTVTGDRATLTGLAATLAGLNAVRYAEPQKTMQIALTPNDPKFTDGTLYGLNGTHGINAPSAWDATTGSTFITVADIDTGMDYDHPDLYENVWINQPEIPASRRASLIDVDGDGLITFHDLNDPRNQGPGKITDVNGDGRIDAADLLAAMTVDAGGNDLGGGGWVNPSKANTQDGDTAHPNDLVGWNFVNNTNNPFDDNGHGTHTAGTIGAIGNNATGVVGMNWKVQIMPLKFLAANGSGSDTAADQAFHYATDHGARVSSNSWGGSGTSSPILDGLTYAAAKGDLVVAAAGNSNTNDDDTFFAPASYRRPSYNLDNMIVVAATDSTGARASFSSYGATSVDLGAPGVNIYSTYVTNGVSGYATLSGTSMATPHVSGTVGLILSQHPTWAPAQVIGRIDGTVSPSAAGSSGLSGITITGGIDNAGLAVDHADWSSYAGNAQHTADSIVPSQPLQGVRWETPVDLSPQYSGSELLIHYGSPLVTQANTVVVPVKTGATNGFEIEGLAGATGTTLWTQVTDYVLPPHNWVPSYSPALTPSGRLYYAGKGGAIYYINSPDTPGATASGPIYFYGQGLYNSSPAAFDAAMFITTPITSDAQGNIYFGYRVLSGYGINVESGIARITPAGVGTWQPARVAAGGDSSITQVVMNCAPALSNDGSTLYVAVSTGSYGSGYLVSLNSTTLSPGARVLLTDPDGNNAELPDDGSGAPTVGPNGDVFYGVLENPLGSNHYRGWLLHFSGNLATTYPPGAFGWDDTASIVPASLVPAYTGSAGYLLFTKYNNYKEGGGDGVNKVAVLDPTATMTDPVTGHTVMKEVLTMAGVTPDPTLPAVKEWCINSAVVDPFTKSVLVNSEDGVLYRWDLTTDTLTQQVTLTPGLGEAYTPTVIGKDGTVYAINNATLFAVGLSATSVQYVTTDPATEGNWKGAYGGDGYNVVDAGPPAYPSYATVTPSGNTDYVWAPSTTDPRALQIPNAAGRIAATWYSPTSFTVDLSLTGGAHQVALYLLDWDQAGRSEKVDILDANSGAVLDSRTLNSFTGGDYLVWDITGHVQARLTATGGLNAVLSGLFFGAGGTLPPPPPPSGSAQFVRTDTATEGSWQGAYGSNGYNVVDAGSSYPTYATVSPSGNSDYVWASSTTDPRALQKPAGPDRIAATWYASTFTVDLNLTGGAHQVALYLLDWDRNGRSERVDVLDANTGAVIDSRTLNSFTGGDYLVWDITGHVQVRLTATAGVNAVLSGLFFDPTA
jgi:subtilisin family serine protease